MDSSVAIKITREARGRVPGDGVELAFGFWPGKGQPLVGLHGLTAHYLNFVGLAEALGGRRSLFALDLRGRGDSDKPASPYGMVQHARDVAVAMRAMGMGSSVVVGHSMGAFVATALAAQYPALVSGLVLIDGGYVPEMRIDADAQQGLDALLALRIMQLHQTYPSREAYREFWRNQPHFPPEDWGAWIEAFLDYELGGEPPQLRPKAAEEAVREDLAEGLKRAEIIERLQAIRVPVLMLRATSGFAPNQLPLFPDSLASQIRACLPQLEDHVISGTTHYTIMLGKLGAVKVADLVYEFAQRCDRTV